MEGILNKLFERFNKKNISNSEIINRLLSIGQQPNSNVEWLSAKNSKLRIKDINLEVIDFTSGILVSNIGHNNFALSNAFDKCKKVGLFHHYHYASKIKADYLNSLSNFFNDVIPNAKFYLTSSGTEACESALKIILRAGEKFTTKKDKVLAIEGNYHGRTAGASLLGDGDLFLKKWTGIDKYFPKIDFPYSWIVDEKEGEAFFYDQINSLNDQVRDSIGGIFIETFQG